MSDYSKEAWYQTHVAEMLAKHGDIPPPWIYAHNSHPFSMGWRMGSGETHIMVFWDWWKKQAKPFEERIAYFRKWPAPPRWCGWMAEAIWDFEASEEDGEVFDYSNYFEQLRALGFVGTEKYEEDLADENYD